MPSFTWPTMISRLIAGESFSWRFGATALILDEIQRLAELADIVVVGADATQEAVGLDRVARRFRHDADGQRMVKRARRLLRKRRKERFVRIAQFQQRHRRGDAENLFDAR